MQQAAAMEAKDIGGQCQLHADNLSPQEVGPLAP